MKYLSLLLTVFILSCSSKNKITIVSDQQSPRINFGIEKLTEALEAQEYEVTLSAEKPDQESYILIAEESDSLDKEGFKIQSDDNDITISGADPSGTLYGILELADQITKAGSIPESINLIDRPEMVLRGTCIGLQKTTYLEGRGVYEYPYTPENFPWFYDKDLWIEYLDMMVDNRLNSLYLWNGHPFASLVKLDDYPFAVEVSDEDFKKNEEIFRFITEEADKRGIWVIQMFYNIIVSKPFAEHYGIETQDRSRPITPVIADYTQKSIAAFVEKYPNVGLLVALGEAMNTVDDDVEWFTITVIPGVQDGL